MNATNDKPSPERIAWLTIRRTRGEEVTYSAGDVVINLVAVATRPDARQIEAGENFVAGSKDLDWLVAPDELVAESGDLIEPQKGATITRKNGEVYRCMPTNSADHTWRWSDPKHTWYRIHSSLK